ncbi:MAG: esterase-like activity of phytase family protein [Kiloniellales bacterium]|nr:esterase-like activity of phytase family protein [Kiloniellales bacterium]
MILRIFLLLCLLAPVLSGRPVPAEPLALTVSRLPLNPEAPRQTTVGTLAWRGSLEISAEDPSFGGLSGLLLEPGGDRLLAVSDTGRWVSAGIRLDDEGFLIGLEAAETGRLRDGDNRPLASKRAGDAEALARLADGTTLVAFEQAHRIWRYPAGTLSRPAQSFPAPPGLDRLDGNSGLEAVTALPRGRLLALAEDSGEDEVLLGFVWQDGAWAEVALVRDRPFQPTGATTLPSGDVLVLERRYSVLGGLGIKIRRLRLAAIKPGATLKGEVLAELRPPLVYDNMEGIAARAEPGGGVRIYLVADDNFNAVQRTVLMSFLLEDG